MFRFRRFALLACVLALAAFPAAVFADTGFAEFLGQLEQEYQLPTGILWKVALAENDGKATGCASTSSACGMFQFITSTWEADTKALYGQPLDPSQRNSPNLSAKAAAYELAVIKTQIGGLITQANVNLSAGLYLGYFLGSGGAKKLLLAYMQNPGQSACALLAPQCAANRSVMANQSVSGLINWAAQKMQATGVPNVAGNFACSNGTSYAYSYCDVSTGNFLPANTAIPANPYGQYATTFPSATNGGLSPALISSPAPATPSTTVTPATAVTATSGSQCSPQYYCSNNTVYYESDACATTTFEMCSYGCLGTICAPASSASSSSLSSSAQPVTTSIGTPVLSTIATTSTSFFFATSSEIGTSSVFSIATGISAGDMGGADATATTSPSATGIGQPYQEETFTPNFSQTYEPAPAPPLFQILDQLKSVLQGLLAYLQTL